MSNSDEKTPESYNEDNEQIIKESEPLTALDQVNKPAGSKKAPDPKKRKTAVIALLALIIIATVGIIGFFYRPAPKATGEPPPNFVTFPTISGNLSSSKDGKTHPIDLDLTIEFVEGKEVDVPMTAAYDTMCETVKSFDYEDLKSADSTEFIKDRVRTNLSQVTDPENIANVYIGNIVIDFPGAINAESETSKANDSQSKLKGLFKNMK